MKRLFVLLSLCLTTVVAYAIREGSRLPQGSVEDRVTQYGAAVAGRWQPYFRAANLAYPPARIALVGLKKDRNLEVYAASSTGTLRFIRSMPILAASGKAGPKLREGDGQVPEGIYGVESLNPNSRFHLALRVGYPNEFDRKHARDDGRTKLGGDIMIHGDAVSIGCLAMGDEGAEDLFILAAKTGIKNIRVILTPVDFRKEKLRAPESSPMWTSELYESIKAKLTELTPADANNDRKQK